MDARSMVLALAALAAACSGGGQRSPVSVERRDSQPRVEIRIDAGTAAPAVPAVPVPLPPRDRCVADADCVFEVYPDGDGCPTCSDDTGPWPPLRAVSARYLAARRAELAARRSTPPPGPRRCNPIDCPRPFACQLSPIGACRAGRCEVVVRPGPRCGQGACPARCGAQPPAPPPAGAVRSTACEAVAAFAWLRCCCDALGGEGCDALKRGYRGGAGCITKQWPGALKALVR